MKNILLLTLFLTGCAPDLDPKYRFSVEQFVLEGKKQGVDLSLRGLTVRKRRSGEKPCGGGDYVGCCTGSTIVISDDVFSSQMYSDVERNLIIFHELGHCVLGRVHTHGTTNRGSPDSIMNVRQVSDNDFHWERDRYLFELFHN